MAQSIEENKGVCGETKVFCRGNQIVVFDTQNRKKILQVSFKSENFHFKRGIFVNGKLYTLHYYDMSSDLRKKRDEKIPSKFCMEKFNFLIETDDSDYVCESQILLYWENGIAYKVYDGKIHTIFSFRNNLNMTVFDFKSPISYMSYRIGNDGTITFFQLENNNMEQ